MSNEFDQVKNDSESFLARLRTPMRKRSSALWGEDFAYIAVRKPGFRPQVSLIIRM